MINSKRLDFVLCLIFLRVHVSYVLGLIDNTPVAMNAETGLVNVKGGAAMKWVIVRRRKGKIRDTFIYNEIHLSPDGTFSAYSGQEIVTFPSMEQAQFVANGFELSEGIEYIVKPYEEIE